VKVEIGGYPACSLTCWGTSLPILTYGFSKARLLHSSNQRARSHTGVRFGALNWSVQYSAHGGSKCEKEKVISPRWSMQINVSGPGASVRATLCELSRLTKLSGKQCRKLFSPVVQSAASKETCCRSSLALFNESGDQLPEYAQLRSSFSFRSLNGAATESPRSSVTMAAAIAWAARALGCRSLGRRHDESMLINT
jgi:hypothetical protein